MSGKEERPVSPPKKSQVDLKSIPARQYLDQTVIPLLISGLSELVKERPLDAVGYLADYLLKHRDTSSPAKSESNHRE